MTGALRLELFEGGPNLLHCWLAQHHVEKALASSRDSLAAAKLHKGSAWYRSADEQKTCEASHWRYLFTQPEPQLLHALQTQRVAIAQTGVNSNCRVAVAMMPVLLRMPELTAAVTVAARDNTKTRSQYAIDEKASLHDTCSRAVAAPVRMLPMLMRKHNIHNRSRARARVRYMFCYSLLWVCCLLDFACSSISPCLKHPVLRAP